MTSIRDLCLYALTYNLPPQFERWCAAFQNAYPAVFAASKKCVVNNSDDPATREAYTRLFARYGFEEIHQGSNRGICGGRYAAAKHFDASPCPYMVFFEDDMLLNGEADAGLCKCGFGKYQERLFEKSIAILNGEKLDYLKLNFSEVFGVNHDNWVCDVLPEEERELYFPRTDAGRDWKVKVHHTGSLEGLPYAVGEYFYCNWPILFGKKANRKIFLDNGGKYKNERVWMYLAYRYLRTGALKAGCLLFSPVNHSRQYDYGAVNRKENEYR